MSESQFSLRSCGLSGTWHVVDPSSSWTFPQHHSRRSVQQLDFSSASQSSILPAVGLFLSITVVDPSSSWTFPQHHSRRSVQQLDFSSASQSSIRPAVGLFLSITVVTFMRPLSGSNVGKADYNFKRRSDSPICVSRMPMLFFSVVTVYKIKEIMGIFARHAYGPRFGYSSVSQTYRQTNRQTTTTEP